MSVVPHKHTEEQMVKRRKVLGILQERREWEEEGIQVGPGGNG